MASNITTEFWKNFLASVIRYVLFAVGGWMQTKGIISHDQAEGFSSLEVAATVGGMILMGLPVWWVWMKTNFTLLFQRALHRADNGTPVEEIKTEVLKEKNTLPL